MRSHRSTYHQVEIEYPRGGYAQRDRQVKTRSAGQAGVYRAIRGVRYIFLGIWRYATAARYQKNRVQNQWFTRRNVMILKLAFAALAVIFVINQDFRVSINLLEPIEKSSSAVPGPVEKMGVAAPVAMKTKPAPEAYTRVGYGSAHYTELNHRQIERYIGQHRKLARKEMQHFGIPASLKLGMAILESKAGKSGAVDAFNNHYGRHLKGVNFQTAASNWRAHSLYLTENYPELSQAGTDYIGWVRALGQSNYGDRENYAQDLLQIIKDYQLYQLDR